MHQLPQPHRDRANHCRGPSGPASLVPAPYSPVHLVEREERAQHRNKVSPLLRHPSLSSPDRQTHAHPSSRRASPLPACSLAATRLHTPRRPAPAQHHRIASSMQGYSVTVAAALGAGAHPPRCAIGAGAFEAVEDARMCSKGAGWGLGRMDGDRCTGDGDG
jgi:hypothetical protein